jgi:uncharacterized repeat protein (TIGR02543 family)
MVVRSTVDPTTAPNVNGIYNVGNTLAVNQTVVYIGTNTSFTDTSLSSGTQYHYRVYTYDKAFNYSSAATGNGSTLATYTLNVTVTGGGTVTKSPDQAQYDAGTVVQLTATPSSALFRFVGWSGDASGTTNPLSVTMNGNKNITANFASNVIISEFRFQGATATDEFIELYNNTNTTIDISRIQLRSSDNQLGLSFSTIAPLPPRAHYLITNQGGYTLSDYGGTGNASPNNTYPVEIDTGANAGLQLLDEFNNTLDAVGFTRSSAAYREGAGMPTVDAAVFAQYSFARKFAPTGFPQDTGDNAADFWFVAPDPALFTAGATPVLGAPGPENSQSPVNRTSQLKSSLIDPNNGSLAGENAKRVTASGGAGTPTAFGTLTLRRRFTNTTGGEVSRLRIRISNITTTHSPGPGSSQADIRALTSIEENVSVTINDTPIEINVRKATLEEPPTQAKGGGYNATLLVDVPGGTIADQAAVVVNLTFGVAKGGSFSLAYVVEAVVTTTPSPGATKRDIGKQNR